MPETALHDGTDALSDRPRDRFGNRLDPTVGYARGRVITGEVAESLRQQRAYALIRDRYVRHGDAGIFNLTGLIRAFPYAAGDDEAMRSYVHFTARSDRELERLAIERMGGTPRRHDGFLATRVTAAMIAIMLTLLKKGDGVLSLVAADRSHPSVKQAAELARASFTETTSLDAFEELLGQGSPPRVAVITTISPSKKHLPQAAVERAIAAARRHGALVMLDDAHMSARFALHGESPSLALGEPDLAVWSLDKHLGGPRSGFVAGAADLIRRIKARALALGVEAQLGQYIAALRAVESFDPEPIRAAAGLAERVLEQVRPATEGKAYLASAGIAVGGEDFLELAMRRAQKNQAALVPIEAVAFASMLVLDSHGGVMIPAVGMPGASCTFRIMTYPDGERFGEAALVEAFESGFAALVAAIDDADKVREMLLGAAAPVLEPR